ncbi:hypothetical protein FHU38_000143 [Saccharomonospora amisosensis]|uniref:Uncharacterized protein n=1 Tax=Saccharomonospora amisosensis TaxID=1128677 RepID=A0A7X5UKQ8_9PSEU|nr:MULTISPECIES: hypothetical protein [Saccharomonospora]NIJ09799.1 hypothetical protein [Saccharomonospora amisosensis]
MADRLEVPQRERAEQLLTDQWPLGHYIALRQRLDTFADTLTATIDNSESRW